ncbi:hypothetical protein ABW19_dt0209941 [Dactylella cylindrospora]|nr:hypothetical protein ABW19_dt0209941 [Dactylella cylindrospora]
MLHGALYVNYFIRSGRYERFFYQDAIFGIVGLAMMNGIFITSLPGYRKKAYKLFFTVHQLLGWMILLVAWFHITYIRRYVLVAGTIYAIDRIGKYLITRDLKVRVSYVSATALDLRGIPSWPSHHAPPGSHYYVIIPSVAGSRGNPFTASSGGDGELKFFVRIRDGFTKQLKEVADASVSIMVEGPYGTAATFPDFGFFDSFLFVTGGVGITMTFSVLRELIIQIEDGRAASLEKARVKFVWAARSTEEAAWPLSELLKSGPTTCKPEVDIFITTSPGASTSEGEEGRASLELHDLVEDSQSQSLLPTTEPNHPTGGTKLGEISSEAAIESLRYRYAHTPITPSIQTGRPDLTKITDEFCSEVRGRRIAVFLCGPDGIKKDVKKALSAHYKDSLIWVWDEKFGW